MMFDLFHCKVIDDLSHKAQWPVMLSPLEKVVEWRNSDNPNFAKKVTASVACVGIALATTIASIAKFVIGILFIIPPFTEIGATFLLSNLFFEPQVFFGSLFRAKISLFHQKVPEFRIDLI